MSHLNAGSPLSRITRKTEEFWNGRLYFPVMLAVTAISMLTDNVVPSTVLLVLLCGWMLVFCRDILAAALPFLLIFLLSPLQYDNLAVFLPCAPLAVVPIGGLLVHLLRWRTPFSVGSCTAGLAAVAAATLLGGLGSISAGEYFSPLAIYYTLGLGLGLLVTYLLLRSELEMPRSYDLLERLMQMLYTMGLAMVLALACFYADHWDLFTAKWEIPPIPYRNFTATILVSTLPSAFFMVRRSRWYLAAVLLWVAALFFSGSRTALLFGGVMLLLGMAYLVCKKILPLWALFVTPSWSQTSAAGRCWRGRGRIFIGIRCWASAWAARKTRISSPACRGAWYFIIMPWRRCWAAWGWPARRPTACCWCGVSACCCGAATPAS